MNAHKSSGQGGECLSFFEPSWAMWGQASLNYFASDLPGGKSFMRWADYALEVKIISCPFHGSMVNRLCFVMGRRVPWSYRAAWDKCRDQIMCNGAWVFYCDFSLGVTWS